MFRTVKQKFSMLKSQYTIFNENGQPVLEANRGKMSSKLIMTDMNGNEVMTIERQGIFNSKYIASIFGQPVFAFIKSTGIMKNTYSFEGTTFYRDGNFRSKDYEIIDGNRPAARVTSKFLSVSDEYSVEIYDDRDELMILAIILTSDMAQEMEAKK